MLGHLYIKVKKKDRILNAYHGQYNKNNSKCIINMKISYTFLNSNNKKKSEKIFVSYVYAKVQFI